MADKILNDPEILVRIGKVRDRLLAGGGEEHVQEVERWEADAKRALIALNLAGHEGIQQLIAHAKEEIEDINLYLTTEPQDAKELADPAVFTAMRMRAWERRRMWEWFRDFFGNAKQDLETIETEVAMQDTDEVATPGE